MMITMFVVMFTLLVCSSFYRVCCKWVRKVGLILDLVNIQPSELAKIIMVLIFCRCFCEKARKGPLIVLTNHIAPSSYSTCY